MRQSMQKQGLRTIAFSYCDFSKEDFDEIVSNTGDLLNLNSVRILEQGNTLLALIALEDNLRHSIKDTI